MIGFYTVVIVGYLFRHYIFTFTALRKSDESSDFDKNGFYEPSVSIVIPARDEEKVIGQLLQGMTELTYSREKLKEIIVINDASSDATGQIAEEYSKRYSFIRVVHRDKKTGGKGKPSAINSCLHLLTGVIVLFFDADYIPQIDIVEKLVRGFVNPKVGAIQGRPVVYNEPKNLVTKS